MKNTIFLIIIISLLCIQKSNAYANSGDSISSVKKILPLKEYQDDFDQMLKTLLKQHPQPYAFISKDSLKSLAKCQYDKITDSTTVGEFLWLCSPVVAAIKCGHTAIWSPDLWSLPGSCYFPMYVKYVGSKLYVIDAGKNSDKLFEGEEILTINGVKAEDFRKEVFQHIPTDGIHESRKHEYLNLNLNWLCPIYFGFQTSYSITIERDGEIKEIVLKESKDYKFKSSFLDACENQLCFNVNKKSNTAVVTIRSFAFYGDKLPIFKSFIDSCFNQIKENKVDNLIIDLRNNGGGDPFCGSYLVQYIANKPFTYFHKDIKGYPELKKVIQPKSNGFKKKPYILINGLCFSTTGHFCSIIKENDFGFFVGTETGGTYTCNDNGKNFTLKNTKLILRTARNTYKTSATSLTNRSGIIPDYPVTLSIEDFLNNTDAVLNYSLKLIEEEK